MRLRYPLATVAIVLAALVIALVNPGYAAWAVLGGLWLASLTGIVGILDHDIRAGDAAAHAARTTLNQSA